MHLGVFNLLGFSILAKSQDDTPFITETITASPVISVTMTELITVDSYAEETIICQPIISMELNEIISISGYAEETITCQALEPTVELMHSDTL